MVRPSLLQRLLQSNNPVPLIAATLVGFVVAIALLLYSQHSRLHEMEATIDENQIAARKMRILSEQMELSRSRSRIIAQLIDTRDPFAQDSLNLELEEYAVRFILLQQELNTLPLSEREQQIQAALREQITTMLPLQRQTVALAMERTAPTTDTAKDLLYTRIMPIQGEMIDHFQQLITWQQQWIDQLAAESHQSNETTHVQQLLLTVITLIIASLATLLVTHRVHLMQRAQQRSRDELDQAVRERTQDLQKARNMLQSVLDTIPVRVFWKGRDSRYLGGNRLFAEDAGLATPQELFGTPIEKTRWAADAERHLQDDREVFEKGVALLNRELPYLDHDSKQCWMELSKVPLRDGEGTVIGLLGCYQDISERHEAQRQLSEALEQARSASLAKSEFLASMSHELRTPLNAILGFAQLLELDQTLAPDHQENVHDILKAGQHLLDLINDILDLSRIEAGHLDLSIERIALDELSQSCAKLIGPMAQKRNITLHYDPAQFAGISLHADYRRTRQVLFNLLSNAVKYNRDGGKIFVTCTRVDGRARIEIRDTGIGIAPAKLTRLFVAFERLGAETGPIEGTGIGLVITRQLVTHMGGTLGFSSVEGEGSSFWFELPLHLTEEPAENHPHAQPDTSHSSAEESTLEQQTLLYIEDNPVNLKLVNKLITTRTSLRLLCADEPLAGIEQAITTVPDLILLDINLPGISGYEVLKRLRAHPTTRDIPVIALTANAMADQVQKGQDAGFDGYLTKPIKIDQFFATLEHHLVTATA